MAYDITSWYPGEVEDGDLLFAFRAPRDLDLATDDGIGYVEFPPDSQVTCDIEVEGSDIGDVVIATDGSVTFTFTGFTLNEGERMEVVLPGSGNEGLANVALTFNAEVNPTPTETQLVYDVGGFFPGDILAGVKVIGCLIAEDSVLITQGLGNARVPPSDGNVTLNVLKNDTAVGTVIVQTSGVVVVNLSASGISLVNGDMLFVQAPLPSGVAVGDPVDSSFADLSVNFQGLKLVS